MRETISPVVVDVVANNAAAHAVENVTPRGFARRPHARAHAGAPPFAVTADAHIDIENAVIESVSSATVRPSIAGPCHRGVIKRRVAAAAGGYGREARSIAVIVVVALRESMSLRKTRLSVAHHPVVVIVNVSTNATPDDKPAPVSADSAPPAGGRCTKKRGENAAHDVRAPTESDGR